MRKNKFIDLELGTAIKRFGLYVAVFVIAFGLTSSIRNAGGTYAISTCPSGYSVSINDEGYCCPSNYEYRYGNSELLIDSLIDKCYRNVETDVACDTDLGETRKIDANGTYCYIEAKTLESSFNVTYNTDDFSIYSKEEQNTYKTISLTTNTNGTFTLLGTDTSASYYMLDTDDDGRKFLGWTKTKGSCANPLSGSQTVSADTTYYACWGLTGYTITYNTDNLTIYSKEEQNTYKTISLTTNTNGTFTLLGTDTSASYYMLDTDDDGRKFLGWTKTKGSCANPLSGSQTVSADTTYYACWGLTGYTITYNTDDWGIYSKDDEESYKTISLNTNAVGTFTLLGTDTSASYYMLEDSGKFLGWTKTKGSCANPLNGSQTVSANTTYYACWGTTTDEGNQPGTEPEQPGGTTGDSDKDETKTYDVTFDVGSGNEFYIKGKKSDDDTITDVSEINFSEYTAEHQDGLDFLGWSETSDCDEAHDTKQFKVEEDTTLYACYADPPSDEPDGYEVTFDVGTDGTFYVNHTKKNNNVLTLSKLVYSTYTAKKDGYVFKGWGTSKNCEKGESRGTLTVEDDTTLYACFVEETDIEENPATGDFLLYLAFLIGILALGYTGYYAYKTVKSRE